MLCDAFLLNQAALKSPHRMVELPPLPICEVVMISISAHMYSRGVICCRLSCRCLISRFQSRPGLLSPGGAFVGQYVLMISSLESSTRSMDTLARTPWLVGSGAWNEHLLPHRCEIIVSCPPTRHFLVPSHLPGSMKHFACAPSNEWTLSLYN